MKNKKLVTVLLVISIIVICILLTVIGVLAYQLKQSSATNTPKMGDESVVSADAEYVSKSAASGEEPLSGKDITFLTDAYLEVTTEQGNGMIIDYAEDGLAVTYIRTVDGDEFEQYQTNTDIYGYALAIDEDGGTSSAGIAHWSGDTELTATKDGIAKLHDEKYRNVLDNMEYVKTVGRDWVYTYTFDNEEANGDTFSVYVDSYSHRITKTVSPYATTNYRYSDKPIDPVYDIADFEEIGGIEEVDDKNTITNMAWAYTVAIVKYDEEKLEEMAEFYKGLEKASDLLGE